VISKCPTTGRQATGRLDADGSVSAAPDTVVMSMLAPQGPFDSEVRQSFCHFAAANSWVDEHPGTFWVDLRRQMSVDAWPTAFRPLTFEPIERFDCQVEGGLRT
jgi:hypothetical protein